MIERTRGFELCNARLVGQPIECFRPVVELRARHDHSRRNRRRLVSDSDLVTTVRRPNFGGSVVDFAEVLIGFVQVAVGLVAFTTISSVVVQVSQRTTASLLALRLKFILLFSMHLIFLSVLPLVTSQLSPDDEQFWRYSAIGSLVSVVAMGYIGFVVLLPKILRDEKKSWSQLIISGTFATLGLGTNIWIVFSATPSFWYMGTLALMLAATLVMVVGAVLSFPIFDAHEPHDA